MNEGIKESPFMDGPLQMEDALGRSLELSRPAERIVSLVPSETETVAALVGIESLVGRTDFCVEPPGIDSVPSVGGTKDANVDAIARLDPDLVLANKEESSRKLVESLIARGLPVHVSFPRTVPEAMAYLDAMCLLLGVGSHARVMEARRAYENAALEAREGLRVFVPIWKDPWMTFDGRAFASDLLELCGATNVFADRPRRYPLAADLGLRAPLDPARVKDRDTRYPRIVLEEVAERRPELVLLPDEPYAFTEADAEEIRQAVAGADVRFVSGQDLFWYGVRVGEAIPRLIQILNDARDKR